MSKVSSIIILLSLLCFPMYGQWQSGGTAIYNTNSGNVGIGTTTPSAKLSVVGSIYKLTLSGIDGTYDNLIKYGHKSDLESGTSYANRWHGIDATITAGAAAANKMRFRLYGGTFANAEPVDVMTLVGNGNVGIGTNNPYQQLSITGGIGFANQNSIDKKLYSPVDGVLEWFTHDYAGEHGFAVSHQGERRVYLNSSGNSYFIGGNLLIGKTSQTGTGTRYKLDVEGPIRAHEIVVNTTGADFVFEPTYKLRSLSELETFIRTNKHLPDIAPAKEMQQNGVSAGEMQAKLLQKVEELTLYVIELKKENEQKDNLMAEQQRLIFEIKKEIEQIKKLK